jgi:hypothetical protein
MIIGLYELEGMEYELIAVIRNGEMNSEAPYIDNIFRGIDLDDEEYILDHFNGPQLVASPLGNISGEDKSEKTRDEEGDI